MRRMRSRGTVPLFQLPPRINEALWRIKCYQLRGRLTVTALLNVGIQIALNREKRQRLCVRFAGNESAMRLNFPKTIRIGLVTGSACYDKPRRPTQLRPTETLRRQQAERCKQNELSNEHRMGVFGESHPKVTEAMELLVSVAAASLQYG